MNSVMIVVALIELILIAAILVWFVISIRRIEGYLRRISLSLPTTTEQMQLINGSISTEAAMAVFEKAGGTYTIINTGGAYTYVRLNLPVGKSPKGEQSNATHSIDPEIVRILSQRDLLHIVRARSQQANKGTQN